jgi:hypothetical protein
MHHRILLLVLAPALLCIGCAEEPGYQRYKAFALEHLDHLEYVDPAGRPKTSPDFGRDYSALPDFSAIEDTRARKQAFFDYLRPRSSTGTL